MKNLEVGGGGVGRIDHLPLCKYRFKELVFFNPRSQVDGLTEGEGRGYIIFHFFYTELKSLVSSN